MSVKPKCRFAHLIYIIFLLGFGLTLFQSPFEHGIRVDLSLVPDPDCVLSSHSGRTTSNLSDEFSANYTCPFWRRQHYKGLLYVVLMHGFSGIASRAYLRYGFMSKRPSSTRRADQWASEASKDELRSSRKVTRSASTRLPAKRSHGSCHLISVWYRGVSTFTQKRTNKAWNIGFVPHVGLNSREKP